MDSTQDFVQKLHEKQRKDEHNKAREGKHRKPAKRLPSKTHK